MISIGCPKGLPLLDGLTYFLGELVVRLGLVNFFGGDWLFLSSAALVAFSECFAGLGLKWRRPAVDLSGEGDICYLCALILLSGLTTSLLVAHFRGEPYISRSS